MFGSHGVLLVTSLGASCPVWSVAQQVSLGKPVVGYVHPGLSLLSTGTVVLVAPGDLRAVGAALDAVFENTPETGSPHSSSGFDPARLYEDLLVKVCR